MVRQPYIVGITGGSASGKSSFAKALRSLFSETELTTVSEDNYYLPKDKVPVDSNGMQNFDTPDAFDFACYINHIKQLKAGKPIQKDEYIFQNPNAVPRLLTLHPTPIIIIEGIFSLHFNEIKDLVDLKLYIDADPETRFNRRVKRDFEERGLDLADVEYRWHHHIAPLFDIQHNEYKKCADLIILNNTSYELGLSIIAAFLRSVLSGPV